MKQQNKIKPWIIKGTDGKYLANRTQWECHYEGKAHCTSMIPILEGKKTVALVVNVDRSYGDKTVEERGERIITAVNNYDGLISALKFIAAGKAVDNGQSNMDYAEQILIEIGAI